MTAKTFGSLEALAVAVAAFEANDGYVKTGAYDYNTNSPISPKYPNKQIMRAYFDLDHYSNDSPRPPLVKVRDSHRERAEEIRNYSKKEIFKVLARKPVAESFMGLDLSLVNTNYAEKLYQLINQDQVYEHDFGFIASAPFYFENGKKRDYAKNVLSNIDSKWVGSVGGSVFLDNFEVLRCSKSMNFEGYVVQGVCDGNLFLYFTSKDCSHIKVGSKINISGKIKDHIMEKDTIPMTKLNFVKERILNETSAAI